MPNLTNFSDDFIKSIVSSIHSAVTDDIIQDTRQADMERSGMNSYPSRIWDLINRNVRTAFTYNPDVVVEFTKRGPWNLIVIFDKTTGMLLTLMREERFCEVKRDSKNHKHYVYELANMFNADLEIQQQSFFAIDENEEKIRAILPGNNCGACGYPGCDGLACAIAKKEAPINQCPVGGEEVAKKIGEIMHLEVENHVHLVAYVKCKGTCDQIQTQYQCIL